MYRNCGAPAQRRVVSVVLNIFCDHSKGTFGVIVVVTYRILPTRISAEAQIENRKTTKQGVRAEFQFAQHDCYFLPTAVNCLIGLTLTVFAQNFLCCVLLNNHDDDDDVLKFKVRICA